MTPLASGPGLAGERLTRDEAFDLVRRAVAAITRPDGSARASAVRDRARDLLGRDSESLSERNFIRILKDAHDADVIDLRRRGDDFEVARAEAAPSVGEQLAASQPAPAPRPESATPARLSLRGRGSGARGRGPSALPPELLSLGVVQTAVVSGDNGTEKEHEAAPAAKRGRKRGAKAPEAAETESPKAAKRPRRPRAKKTAKSAE